MPTPAPAMSRALGFSASSSRRVFLNLSGLLQRSSIRRRGRSSTATFPSASLRPEKGKRPTKEERRALVKSFVDKYRSSNAGKFPSVSLVKQEVGGSYYVVRQIVQEMEYDHKFSPSKNETHKMDKVEGIKDQSVEQFQMPKAEERGGQSHEPLQTAKVVNEIEVEHKLIPKSEVEEAFWHPSGQTVCRTIEDTVVEHSRDGQSANTITSDIDENQRNRTSEAGMTTAHIKQEEVVSEVAPMQEIIFLSKTESVRSTKMEACGQNFDTKNKLAVGGVWKSDVKTDDKPAEDISKHFSRQTIPKHPPDKQRLSSSNQTAYHRDSDIAEQKREDQKRYKDEGSSGTSSLWRNLKSFTDGIFGFWKKL